MPVVTRVVRRLSVAALETHVHMPTQTLRAAVLDRVEYRAFVRTEGVGSLVVRAVSSHDVREFQARARALRQPGWTHAGRMEHHDWSGRS